MLAVQVGVEAAEHSASGSGALVVVLVLLWSGLAAAQSEPAEYLGDEVCAACHEDLLAAYQKTRHAKLFGSKAPHLAGVQTGCEACHGPGSQHVEAGGGNDVGNLITFRAEDAPGQSREAETCMKCHEGEKRLYWHGSVHPSADVSCKSCHTVMKANSRENLLTHESETETCAQCHLMPRSQQFRNAHMPVREGKMSCSSCHNPHGTIADRLISDHTINDGCYRCHAEKRGPFAYEHPPVYENCLNCHHPHGSTRRAMLKLSLPRLCQQCHVGGHGGSPRDPEHRFVISSSCLQCHPNVHGSNHPSGERFTR